MTLMLALAATAGVLVAVQAPVNAELGRHVGTVTAAAVSFAVGTVVLVALAGALGQLGGLGAAGEVGPQYYVGGLLGAFFVTVALIAVPKIGAGALTAAVIAGQLSMSLLIDRMGWLGVPQQDVSATRLLGAALLVIGVLLIVRR